MCSKITPLFSSRKDELPFSNFTHALYGDVLLWESEEFVPGSLFRILWDKLKQRVSVRGRNEEDFVPQPVFSALLDAFNSASISKALDKFDHDTAVLYCRAPVIQDNPCLILVDVELDNKLIRRDWLRIIAIRLNINTPPFLGEKSPSGLAEFIATKPMSYVKNTRMKGIVARSCDGGRYTVKLLSKDFK